MSTRNDEITNRYSLGIMSGHIPLHQLWACVKGRRQWNAFEHAHVEACDDCSQMLKVCFDAENFGAVLRKIHREHDSAEGERPKLKTLYVVSGLFRSK